MKRENAFIAVMTVSGVISGLLIIIILAAIAVPSYINMVLTLEEKKNFESMGNIFEWAGDKMTIILSIIMIVIALAVFVFYLLILNPRIKKSSLKNKKSVIKLITAVIISIIALPLLFAVIKEALGLSGGTIISLLSLDSGRSTSVFNYIGIFVENALLGGLIWLIIGEMGWLGDLSSWKMGMGGKEPRPLRCFIMGSVVGIILAGVLLLMNWFFMKYFILVSEVLDRAGETSLLGFKYLAIGLMLLHGVTAGIIAGLTVALSPTYRDRQYRRKRLVFPVVLALIMVATIFGYYQYASAKYDLNKSDLAEAVGLPDKASKSRTVLIFRKDEKGNDLALFEWPLKVTGWGLMAEGTIEVSHENLEKVIGYLNEHKEGSVYQYAAKSALYNGYHVLWDMEKGIMWQRKVSNDLLIARMQLINRLQHIPVTEKHLEYLRSFLDENKWYIGKRYAVRLAKALVHFDEFDDAKKLIDKAREKGVDPSEIEGIIPANPVLTDGKLTGKILVSGKAASNMKVAIFKDWDVGYLIKDIAERSEYLTDAFLNAMTVRMVDVKQSDDNGNFIFNHLGNGEYTVALMTEREVIPYDISLEKIQVQNAPDVITLSRKNARIDIGNLNIVLQ